MKKVIVGMSGGVDSAVSAYLLKEAGYDVIGVFMKNWDEEIGGECTAERDFEDVRGTCDILDIPYYSVNFEKEYWDRVFKLFLDEYARGRTPNPDVLCNKEIKFNAFLDFAYKSGAEMFATGHYARLVKNDEGVFLRKAIDKNKDQTYFLCLLTQDQLKDVVFPIGDLEKSEVRVIADKLSLNVAKKKDSTGICFIGERKFKKFLENYLPAQPGDMMTTAGELIGRHDGLMYYTLGQRRGLNIGGRGTGERWFVVSKDLKNNILYVEQGSDNELLYSSALNTGSFNYINRVIDKPCELKAKFRYRQPDQEVYVSPHNGCLNVEFKEKQRAVTPGQYCVLYDDDICIGGGVIEEVLP